MTLEKPFEAKIRSISRRSNHRQIEALRQFNDFFEARRLRLFYVTAGIPPVMWYTVGVDALINMVLIWMFDLRLRTGRSHLVLYRHNDLFDRSAR